MLVVAVLALSVVRVIVRHVLVALQHVVESAIVAVIVVQVVVQEAAVEVAVVVVLMTVPVVAVEVVLELALAAAPDHALGRVLIIAKPRVQAIAKAVAQLGVLRVMVANHVVDAMVLVKLAVILPVMQVRMHKF